MLRTEAIDVATRLSPLPAKLPYVCYLGSLMFKRSSWLSALAGEKTPRSTKEKDQEARMKAEE